jgi:O-antigen/teichoic acid export membrane protein
MVAVAIIIHSDFMFWLALSIHGILIFDFVKIYNMSIRSPRVALRQQAAWSVLSATFIILGLSEVIRPSIVFLGWAASCAVVGYSNGVRQARTLRPSWPRDREETRISIIYSLDFLAGSGGAQLSTYFIAGLASTVIVGTLRGAGIFYSPFRILTTTALALAIPYLTRARTAGGVTELKSAKRLAGVQLLLIAPPAFAVVFLPVEVYRFMLGATGSLVPPVMLPLAIESLFSVATTVAFAGHRAQRAGIRTLAVRGVMAPLRVVVVVVAAVQAGAIGAAWAMAGMAILGTAFWWWSYSDLARHRDHCEERSLSR